MAKKKSNKKNIKAAYMDKKVALAALTARTRGPARSVHRTVSVQGCPVLTVKNGAGMADSKVYVLAQAQSEHPKISVVMPVYNVADFVAESLDSVLSQSLTDLEIICVDDGSTDASLDIVRSYAKREGRITILAQQNAGSGRARNAGIAVARGEFIAFLDSDDLYPTPETLAHLYQAAIREQVMICGGSLAQLKEGELITDPARFEDGYTFAHDGRVDYRNYQFDYGYWRFIYRRSFLVENEIYFPDYLRQQDPPFFVRAMATAGTFYALAEPTYVYRVSHKKIAWTERKATDLFRGVAHVLSLAQEYGLDRLYGEVTRRVNTWTFRTAAAATLKYPGVRQQVLKTLSLIDTDRLSREGTPLIFDESYQALMNAEKTGVLVSVIVPVYNVEKYLARCLDSILGQTLDRLEIICVDDGSTDSSGDILRRYQKKDRRIVIVHQKNGGLSAARNTGMQHAQGAFICYVDSDDWIEPTTLEQAVAEMHGPVDLVSWGAAIDVEDNVVVSPGLYAYHAIKMTGQRDMTDAVMKDSTYTVWNKLFKKRILDQYHIRFTTGRLFEDNDFTLKYMLHCRAAWYLGENLYHYVQRPGSIMDKIRQKSCTRTVDNLFIFDSLYQHCVQWDLLADHSSLLANRFYIHLKASWTGAPASCHKVIRETATRLAKGWDAEILKNKSVLYLQRKSYDRVREFDELIISLTSWPGRIDTVSQTIETLLNQSLRAERVILWLAPEQFPGREADLPADLLALKARGLTIGWYRDIRSYKKLIPTLRQYPNAVIITADDDNLYPRDWLRKLYEGYKAHPADIQCHRVTKFVWRDGRFDTVAGGRVYYHQPSYLNKLVGLGGVLYPPHCFADDILNEALIKKLAPTNDDQWFWLQAARNGVRVRVVDHPDIDAHYIPGTQAVGLTTINDHGENLFWKDFNRILRYYPDVRDLLIREAEKMQTAETFFKNTPYRDALEKWYLSCTHQRLNLRRPKTYNEKMQWLKLYDSTPLKTRLADKYLVRQWVRDKIGGSYLIPLLGVYNRFEDIDFRRLPKRFVIKCNHGCQYNIIVKDKSKLDLADVKAKLDTWMRENFAFHSGLELHYRDIKPRIIIEQFIENKAAGDLYDYKFWCFNGRVAYIQFLSERNIDGLKMAFYDRQWRKQDFVYSYPLDKKTMPRPDNLDEMIALAEKLSGDFGHVRVDFYRLDDGRVYFGEMTFTSASGGMKWSSEAVNRRFGDMIKLPQTVWDMDAHRAYKRPKNRDWLTYLMTPWLMGRYYCLSRRLEALLTDKTVEILSRARIDVKNVGGADNAVVITGNNIRVSAPAWAKNAQGIGQVVVGKTLTQDLTIRAVHDGTLTCRFMGSDLRQNGGRIPIWIDYTDIVVDGRPLPDTPVETWYEKPFRFDMPVRHGQTVRIQVRERYHAYTPEDGLAVVSGVNPELEDAGRLKRLTAVVQRRMGVLTERDVYQKHMTEIRHLLQQWRIDVKNVGSADHAVAVSGDGISVLSPAWACDQNGRGQVVIGKSTRQTMTIRAKGNGTLVLKCRGVDRKNAGERVPVWVDYTAVVVDGKPLLKQPKSSWYEQVLEYRVPVKDGQTVSVEIMTAPHAYTADALRATLLGLGRNDGYLTDHIEDFVRDLMTSCRKGKS